MSIDIVHASDLESLTKLRLGHLATRLDALLADAARSEPVVRSAT